MAPERIQLQLQDMPLQLIADLKETVSRVQKADFFIKAGEHMFCTHLREMIEFVFDKKLLDKTGKFRVSRFRKLIMTNT